MDRERILSFLQLMEDIPTEGEYSPRRDAQVYKDLLAALGSTNEFA